MLVVAETTTVCFEVQSTFDAAFMVFDLAWITKPKTDLCFVPVLEENFDSSAWTSCYEYQHATELTSCVAESD